MIAITTNPFPVLFTERLILREPTLNDTASLFDLRSDVEVMKYVPREPAKNIDDIHNFINIVVEWHEKKQALLWAMCESTNPGYVLGTIGLWKFDFESRRGEVGYMLNQRYQAKGFMSEALNRVLIYGFDELNLHSIEARVDDENLASIKVVEKAGFIREGLLRENVLNKGQFRSDIIYSLLKKNFKPAQSVS